MVGSNLTAVRGKFACILKIFNIISYRKNHLVCYQLFIYQVKGQQVCHFTHDKLSFFKIIGTLQNLSCAYAVVFGPVGFYIFNSAGFIPPGMVYKKLGVYAEQLIQKILVVKIILSAE